MDNQNSSNQENYSNQENPGDSSSQKGNFGIGSMSGGEVKGNAKIAGVIEQKIQEIIGRNVNQAENIINIKNVHIIEPKEAGEGSIKVILKGSPTEFEQLKQILQSNELINDILEKEFNIIVKNFNLLDHYSEDQAPTTTEKRLDFTTYNKVNISNTIILVIFPYGGYTKDDKNLENNFWELIKKCQKYSKYKPIVVINRDTIIGKKAERFSKQNLVVNNNIVEISKKDSLLNPNAADNLKKNVDLLEVWSVDTCQMWLHGWGQIIDKNENLPSGEKIERIIQLPGDIEKITDKPDFYKKLNDFCSTSICTIDDDTSSKVSCYDIVLGDFETEKFVGKSLIDSYGTFPLLANWFPKISKKIFSLKIYKPRTEFLNLRVDILKKLLEYRPFAYEQTLNMLINLINLRDEKRDDKQKEFKYSIGRYNLGNIEDHSDYRDYQECLDQIERTERMLKYLWREANAPEDTEDDQEFKKFMDDYDFLCQRSQAICETARVTIRSLLGLGI